MSMVDENWRKLNYIHAEIRKYKNKRIVIPFRFYIFSYCYTIRHYTSQSSIQE